MKYWEELNPGEVITDFRGDQCTFIGVERRPTPGRDGKVVVRTEVGRPPTTFYAKVFPDITWKITELVPDDGFGQ